MRVKSFYLELKRRNVLKSTIGYIVFSWILIQVASIFFPTFNISNIWLQVLMISLLIGLGIWILISWHFEIGNEGIVRTKPLKTNITADDIKSQRINYIFLWVFVSALLIFSLTIYFKLGSSPNNLEQDLVSPQQSADDKSVAVLAFLDLSPTHDNEYFSDGISEEILNYLAKNPELMVISRTSSFSFKGKDTNIKDIGKQLNANYILEGSVRKRDSSLRITAQLIRADNGMHLWSETYQRKLEDIFEIQDEIARQVSEKLKVSLVGDGIIETDSEAYIKYLQAKGMSVRFNQESSQTGLTLINESLEIDSTYAPAWLLKSKLHYQLRVYASDETQLVVSKTSALKSIELSPNYAEAYAWLGRFEVKQSEFNTAYQNFQKALQLDPENSEVLRHVSAYPSISLEDRILLLQYAMKLDPLDSGNYRTLSIYYFFQEKFEDALSALDTYLIYQPYGGGDHGLRAEFLAWLGKTEDAQKEIEQEEDEFSKAYSETMVALVLGQSNSAEMIEERKDKYFSDQPYLVAQIYALLNDKKNAYATLNKALSVEDYDMYFQLKNDPYMLHLRDEKMFKELLNKIEVPKTLDISYYEINTNPHFIN